MSTHIILPGFDINVQSSPLAARDALEQLTDRLAPLCLDVEEGGTVELVMAEVLNNIVEHSYPAPDTAGDIRIHCKHKPNGLNITIVDKGKPMPDNRTPLGLAVDIDVDLMNLPEGGFGWFLIKDLAKDVTYERLDGENHLSLRIAVATR